MTASINRQRRALLLGRRQAAAVAPLRPPWALPEPDFLSRCTRCGDCVEACPEDIIVKGEGGFPAVDFNRGECTFCEACVEACTVTAFTSPAHEAPWDYRAHICGDCLAYRQIYCRSCGESCEVQAISFDLRPRSVPQPQLNPDVCTGCGACVAVCPTSALQVTAAPAQPEQER